MDSTLYRIFAWKKDHIRCYEDTKLKLKLNT